MKQLIALLAVLLLSMFTVTAAVDITVDPVNVNLPDDKSVVDVDVTVALDDPTDLPVPLIVDSWCKEVSGVSFACDESDIMGTSEITVTVDTWTDENGKAKAHLNWNGGDMGEYHYTICVAGSEGGECISSTAAAVTGDAFIPEFTVIGGALALVGAGLLVNRKRKK